MHLLAAGKYKYAVEGEEAAKDAKDAIKAFLSLSLCVVAAEEMVEFLYSYSTCASTWT
jgi:hypothetical protein